MIKIILSCMTLLILTSSCSGDIAAQITGEWECARLGQVLQIEPNGMVRLIDTKTGYAVYEGTYSIEGKKIVFSFARFSRPVTRTIQSVRDDKLILHDANGIEEKYIKKH